MITEAKGPVFMPLTRPGTIKIGGKPALQLGAQYVPVPESAVPAPEAAGYSFYAVRLSPSFGSDGFRILNARLDFELSQDHGELTAFDIYPRTAEEIRESEIELALGADLTWIPAIKGDAKVVYKTKFRRIHTYLDAGGNQTEFIWWKFKRRKETRELVGTMDLMLMIQATKGIPIRGDLVFEAELRLAAPLVLKMKV